MTEWLNWIITPLVGAGIGYSTNWLAIKMLFKPHKEIRIGKLKVPFTPGLIPNERERIAKKISEAVGGYVLTEEVLNRELKSESVQIQMRNLFREKTQPLVVGMVIDELLDEIFRQDKERIVEFIQKKINAVLELELALKGEDLQQLVFSKLEEKFSPYMTIGELIGEDIWGEVKEALVNDLSSRTNSLKDFLKRKDIRARLERMLSEVISEKFGALGAMFVDASSVYNIIIDKAEELLNEEETHSMIKNALEELFLDISNRSINEFIAQEAISELFHQISRDLINELYSNEFRNLTNEVIKDQIDSLLKQRIAIPPEVSKLIEDRFIEEYEKTVDEKMTHIIKTIDFSRIIEEQINAFDIKDLEEMILSIAQKELRAITWLGALLGCIMAFVLMIFK